LISLKRIYKENGFWYVSGSSEVFENREQALKRVMGKKTSNTKKQNRSNKKFVSDRFNLVFRSSWEVELAEVMDDLGIEFKYEPKRYYFRAEKESYLPDFYLPEFNCWIEVKGYMDKRSEKRCKLFKRYFKSEFGFFLWMKEERELTLKTPELLYTFLEIAEKERERCEKNGSM
jgi:hypothetical protein